MSTTLGDEEEGGGDVIFSNISPPPPNPQLQPTPTPQKSKRMKYNTTNNNQESRRISAVVSDYMNSNTSGNTVQPKTTNMSAEVLDEMVDEVMEDYTDDNGNVNTREIVKDSIQSGVEKVEQRIENHYLANLVKHLNASAKKRSMIFTLLIVLLVICTSIAIFFGTKGTMITGTEQVKDQLNEGTAALEDAINNTQETLIQMDDQGHPLVLDRKTGLVTSSRVVGDPFIAEMKSVSGRNLMCLDIGSVGSLFNDAKTRTPSSVTFMNEDGLEEKVIPLDSYYEDNDDSLFFGGPHGGITVLLNSDICNTVVNDMPQDDPQDMPSLGDMPLPDMPLGDPQDIQGELEVVDNATEEMEEDAELTDVKYELDIQSALDEAQEIKDSSEEEEDTDLFKRGLRDESSSLSVHSMSEGPQGIARVPSLRSSTKSESTRGSQGQDVKAYLRDMYALAKTASVDGRKLNDGTSVVVCEGTSCPVDSQVAGYTHFSTGGFGIQHVVTNGGFEGNVQATWTRYTSGGRNGYTVSTSYKNSGSQSIKVTNGGASQWIQLDAPARSTITISGFSKAVGTSTGLWDYSVYADVHYVDGTHLWGQKAKFTGGTHDWEFSEYSFTVPKAVNGIVLYALYRDDPAQGTAYFDDVAVTVKPNMVVNGGFEGNVYATWTRYTSGGRNGYTINTTYKNSGSQSIKVTNGGASQYIPLDAPARSTITISGFSKAVGTSTGLWDYSVYADVHYVDGTYLWGQKAKFTGGTHDWEFSEYSFTVPKAVRDIILYALYRDDPAQGTAYFDDLAVFVETPCPRGYSCSTSCDIDGTDSDGSAGNLVADSSGNLLLNGIPIASLSLGNGNTLGTAYNAVTTINNVDRFIIPEGVTVYLVGTVKIHSRRAVIDGTLDGTGGGYPGGESPPDTNGHGKGGISSSGSQSGGGGGSNAGSGGIGGEEGCSGGCNLCDYNLCSNCFVNQPEINRYCTSGLNHGGRPGNEYDNTLPLTLRPGSGGGGGAGLSGNSNVDPSPGGAGGAGGAAMHLYGAEIVLNGNIYANGSNGLRPDDPGYELALGGGGGGSGGSVRFSACTLTAGSNAKIEVKGGTGGRARGTGGGGGGGGGGAFISEATIVNYDGNGMTINVNEGARGEADQETWTPRGSYNKIGFVGSAGKVFLLDNLNFGSSCDASPPSYLDSSIPIDKNSRCASGICRNTDNKCVECLTNGDCPGEFQRCDTSSNTCKQVCSSGVLGISGVDGIYCCHSKCGQCGGSGCGSANSDNIWDALYDSITDSTVYCCSEHILEDGWVGGWRGGEYCESPSDIHCIIKGPGNNPYGLVQNNDFELGKAAWSRYTSGGRNGYTVDTLHKNSGSQSIKVTNGGASQWIQLDAPARSTITISGYSKAVGTSSGLPRVEASVYYADGTNLWGQQARFSGGTHDWEFSEYSFTIPKAVNGIILYALYRDDPAQGTAYFDDVSLTAAFDTTGCTSNSQCPSGKLCDTLRYNQCEPACSTGITDGGYCCAKSCGRCGGSGCSGLPGGRKKCCTSSIQKWCQDPFQDVCRFK